MPRTIFDIDAELDQIADAYDRLDQGEGTEEDILAAVERYFGDLSEERDRKLDNYATLIAFRIASSEARKSEADRLELLAKTDINTAKNLKRRLMDYFAMRGITKIETAFHKFGIQRNGGKVPLEIDEHVQALDVPEKYRKVVTQIDPEAVRLALEQGEELSWAKFGEVGQHLRIR